MYFINFLSIFLGFFSILIPNLFYFILYKIFVEKYKHSAKKILLFLYFFEVLKIVLFIVLCIFIFNYVTINSSLYFISLCFIQILFFLMIIKKTF